MNDGDCSRTSSSSLSHHRAAEVVVQGAESGSDAVRLRFAGFSAVEICPQLCIQSRTFRQERRGT